MEEAGKLDKIESKLFLEATDSTHVYVNNRMHKCMETSLELNNATRYLQE